MDHSFSRLTGCLAAVTAVVATAAISAHTQSPSRLEPIHEGRDVNTSWDAVWSVATKVDASLVK